MNDRRDQKIPNPVIPAHLTWKCEACKALLGYTNEDRTELRIKFKDQYLEVVKPEVVRATCRRCAKWNVVEWLER